MNANSPLHDPTHWHKRAEATRAKAELLAEGGARQKLLRVAGEYERLAQRAEQWLMVQKDKPSELSLLSGAPLKSPR
jgi:hypothetical protein